jgi:flagellin
MTVINTNVNALYAQGALAANSRGLQKAMTQLSTGLRINSAGDDAAGMSIVNNLNAQIKGLNQAVRNANDGISMLQTAEGATNEVTSILQRMRELAVQAANGTYSTDDLSSLQAENLALQDELDRVASVTQWNGITLLSGSLSASFHIGYSNMSDEDVSVKISQSVTAAELGVSASISAGGSAATSYISAIDTALTSVNTIRGTLGATINRFQFTTDALTNMSTHLSESKSRVQDTDYGDATSELAKHQVLQQAATAMLAQANQQPQLVLSLLK